MNSFYQNQIFIQSDVDVQKADEPISRKEFNDLKIDLSDLKIRVEATLKLLNQPLSSPNKRKVNIGSKGNQCFVNYINY